jgi:hypothetical protein
VRADHRVSGLLPRAAHPLASPRTASPPRCLPTRAELFVSVSNPFPGYLNFTWASTTTNADERLWIPTSDPFYPGWTPFTFYIGVLGYNGNAT